jgi:ubiquitin carboxyl-terminal hydrolase L3
MNLLAKKLGLSDSLAFYDVYSLDEPDLLSHIPRPAYALLVIIPLTPAWHCDREAEDQKMTEYEGHGSREPVVWFQQTIGDACGSYGLLHCAINGPATSFIQPGSALEQIRRDAIPLKMKQRAELLYNNEAFEEAHQSVANLGDTATLPADSPEGGHFVSFVKADDGHLWELEGSRLGPLDRGKLKDDEDVLSPAALERGLKRIIMLDQDAGGQDLRFSCIALAPKTT